MSLYGTFETMPTDAGNVCFSGVKQKSHFKGVMTVFDIADIDGSEILLCTVASGPHFAMRKSML
jgi:hypothetical protein